MQRIGSGHYGDCAVLADHQGQTASVAKPCIEDHLEQDLTRHTLDNANNVAPFHARRHEIYDADPTAVAVDLGFQNHCVAAVALFSPADSCSRAHSPTAMLVPPEQCRHARFGVEPGHAHPVDVPALRDEGRSFHISNESVVFDTSSHCFSPVKGPKGT